MIAQPSRPDPDERAIRAWLIEQVANQLGMDPGKIDPRCPLAAYGLDSADAVGLSGHLEEWLGRRVAPTVAWAHPTIEALARHLAAGGGDEPEDLPPCRPHDGLAQILNTLEALSEEEAQTALHQNGAGLEHGAVKPELGTTGAQSSL
jgi:acyl carrier protein